MFSGIYAAVSVSFPGLGIEDLQIDRVAFSIGSFDIYWYGICIVLGFALCIGLAMKQSRKFGFTPDDVIDIALVTLPAAIIGGRLYYVASAWDMFADDPLSIFNVRTGGLAIYGGVILSFIAITVLAKIKKQNIGLLFNVFAVYLPLGQAIGRWGNFFNQEAFGTNTDLPWGMISSTTSSYIEANCPTLDSTLPVHPTFLYESLACLAIFFVLLAVRKHAKMPFTVLATYFILYGIERFFVEGLRTDSLYIGNTGLRTSQVLSALLVVLGIAMIVFFYYRGIPANVKVVKESASKETSSESDEGVEQSENNEAEIEEDASALPEDSKSQECEAASDDNDDEEQELLNEEETDDDVSCENKDNSEEKNIDSEEKDIDSEDL